MRNYAHKLWGALVAILLTVHHFSLHASEIVLSAMNYPPFYGEVLEESGPLAEIISASLEVSGRETKYIFSPWARAVKDAKEKADIHGVVGVWFSEARSEFFLYSDPIIPNQMVFYKNKGSGVFVRGPQDLIEKNYKVGLVRGYTLPKAFNNLDLNFDLVEKDIQNLRKLALGRIDLIVVDKDYAKYELSKYPRVNGKVERVGSVIWEEQQHLVISRNTENAGDIIEDFNEGMKAIKQSGDFERILNKHGFEYKSAGKSASWAWTMR